MANADTQQAQQVVDHPAEHGGQYRRDQRIDLCAYRGEQRIDDAVDEVRHWQRQRDAAQQRHRGIATGDLDAERVDQGGDHGRRTDRAGIQRACLRVRAGEAGALQPRGGSGETADADRQRDGDVGDRREQPQYVGRHPHPHAERGQRGCTQRRIGQHRAAVEEGRIADLSEIQVHQARPRLQGDRVADQVDRRDRPFRARDIGVDLQMQDIGSDTGVGQRDAQQIQPTEPRRERAGVQALHQVKVELDADRRAVEGSSCRTAGVDRRFHHLQPQAHIGDAIKAERSSVDRDRGRRGEDIAEVVELHAAGEQIKHVEPDGRQRAGRERDLQDVRQADGAARARHAKRQRVEHVGRRALPVGLQHLHHRRAQLAQGDVGVEHLAGIADHHAAVELGQQRVEIDVGTGQVVPVGHAEIQCGAGQQCAEQQIEDGALRGINRGQAGPGAHARTGRAGRLRTGGRNTRT
ncbi:hypothetical protein D3C71_1065210 [compost metagenome]